MEDTVFSIDETNTFIFIKPYYYQNYFSFWYNKFLELCFQGLFFFLFEVNLLTLQN